jgi:HSP20 family protein
MFGKLTSLQSSLLDEFWRLQQEMGELLGDGLSSSGGIRSLPRGSFPALNVVQTPEAVQVYVFAPGLDPKKLDVSIQQGLLTISGERQIPIDDKATYYRQERFAGEFRRAISLGEDVDAEHVAAKYRDGIVQIRLHRRESAKPRQIEIH